MSEKNKEILRFSNVFPKKDYSLSYSNKMHLKTYDFPLRNLPMYFQFWFIIENLDFI